MKVLIICRHIYFYSRVKANCIYKNGAVTPVEDILEYAEEAKENISGSLLSSTSLGFIVKDVWGAAIHRARRGPRNQQQSVYLNLRVCPREDQAEVTHGTSPISLKLSQMIKVIKLFKSPK